MLQGQYFKFDIEKIYYNFLPYELIENINVPNYEYHCEELNEMLPDFNKILPLFSNKTHIVQQGEIINIDECFYLTPLSTFHLDLS